MPDDAAPLSTDLHYLSITEAARLIEQRRLSPVELTQAYLKRVEAFDPQLNAFLLVTADRALAQAKAAETEIAAGRYRGPMHGIPFALKDIYCTAGIRTTCHSRTRADYVPGFDATTVAKLYEAGAVLLGKLSTHEFAHGGPSFDLPWPVARNPWNREYATGGSSSGSGASVAAGLAPGSLGSDTGGSIRNPAALCGLVGLKPTYGLVSRAGVYANSFSYDHAGPMTWTVEDCAIMLQAIAGYDPKDPASASRDVPDFRADLSAGVKGLRIGVLRHLYEDDVPVAASVKTALEQAYEVLRGLGATVEDARIRPAHDYHAVKITGAESELFAVHEPVLRTRLNEFGADFLGRVLGALLISGPDYVQASRQRRMMIAEMAPLYARYDVLLTAGPGPASRLDAWRTINFWQRSSVTTPFNVTGGPALVQCIGFTGDGLPLSMQVVGRPFADAMVLRVAKAYEDATPWRRRRPELQAGATPLPAPPVPQPEKAAISQFRRDETALICQRRGLTVPEPHLEQLYATAPYVDEMVGHLGRSWDFTDEPASVFQFPRLD
ncbi:MAG: aspartyl-tRNA(Asn)/glutamyl-tRNA(Gln) amidotransferase subunit [Acetobacteraceae bacterium]|jgi:aspartyl-tRNA(Asn)/glutamyl-tRNA(Gln) amidotransferase subunit A|nr:aspartyl-tRNA(Asn)/glutamyl-tRNA(Gln) amidotransferase subunit [Acetobacteraceae bacterium]